MDDGQMLWRKWSPAGWGFCALVVAAPLLYGGTLYFYEDLEAVWCGVVFGVWVVELLLLGRWSRVKLPWGGMVLLAAVLLQGWWMVGNARSVWDAQYHEFAEMVQWVPWAAGTWTYELSLREMLLLSALGLLAVVGCDLVRDPVWRFRVMVSVMLGGVLTCWMGILFKVGGMSVMREFWDGGRLSMSAGTLFGPFRYHGHAGAFINMVWPLVVLCAGRVFSSSRGKPEAKAAVCMALFSLATGALMNSSKMGFVVWGALTLVLAAWMMWHYGARKGYSSRSVVQVGVGIGLTAAVLFAVVMMSGVFNGVVNIADALVFGNNETFLKRSWAYRVCMKMIPDAGVMGFGPGSFQAVFQPYQKPYLEHLSNFWMYAHQDYLQTAIEWGWSGTFLFGLLICWPVARGFSGLLMSGERLSWDRVFGLGAVSGILVFLVHGLVDFPSGAYSIRIYTVIFLAGLWSERLWIVNQKRYR